MNETVIRDKEHKTTMVGLSMSAKEVFTDEFRTFLRRNLEMTMLQKIKELKEPPPDMKALALDICCATVEGLNESFNTAIALVAAEEFANLCKSRDQVIKDIDELFGGGKKV